MSGRKKSGSKHEYHVGGDAAIISGTVKHSEVKVNLTKDAKSADPLEQLAKELTRIRQRLEEHGSPDVAPDDRYRALGAVIALSADVPSLSKPDPKTRRTLRERVSALIGILAPVAEIIGGGAALYSILHQL